jgi:ribosomal protein S6--L-glutamate ligase
MRAVTERLGEPPWVLKTTPGTKGEGVMLVESEAALEALAALLFSQKQRFLVQRFVRESAGSDVRVLFVGGRAVVAMRRQAALGEFRSNLHLGGTAEPFELTAELTDLAERSARCLGLEVAGIDLLLASGGPLVLEVNGSPGLAGIEDATGVDVSARVVRFLERLAPG